VSDVRCRACGAAVPDQAQWCSLCYADLRPPAPVREPVSVPAGPSTPAGVADPAAADAPAQPARTPQPPRQEPRWPCPRCGVSVLMSLEACPDCGAGFLAGATDTTATRLPLVGDVQRMNHGQRLLVGGAISIVLMVVFVLIAEIGGHIF
jgi:hypothetical protein